MKKFLILAMSALMVFACGKKSSENNSAVEKSNTQTQVAGKTYKIGVTQFMTHPSLDLVKKGFEKAFEEAGIKADFDEKNANGEVTTANLIASNYKADKKDLVFAVTTPTAQAAKNQVDKSIPVVFASVTDPKSAGLEGIPNVTGTSGAAPINENLKLMRKIFPKAKNIGIIYNSSEQNSVSEVNNLKKLAKENGFNVVDKAITNGTELLAAANIISKEIDIYYATQDNTVASYFAALLDVLNKAKVPVFATNDVYSNAGAFISQGTTDYGIGYRSGEIAAEILLKGKKPSDFPIETVKDLQIKVSKSNMEFLGIKLPKDVESQVIFTK